MTPHLEFHTGIFNKVLESLRLRMDEAANWFWENECRPYGRQQLKAFNGCGPPPDELGWPLTFEILNVAEFERVHVVFARGCKPAICLVFCNMQSLHRTNCEKEQCPFLKSHLKLRQAKSSKASHKSPKQNTTRYIST